MVLSRTFAAGEDRIDDPQPVMVLSYQLWERRFNRDERVSANPYG